MSQDNVATVDSARALVESRASDAAQKLISLTVAEQIAKRVKDPTALERALTAKLDNQAEFAAQYQALFPVGRPEKNVARSGQISPKAEEWCLSYGFGWRTVRRWTTLCDPDIRVEREAAISKKCWELAELWKAANFSSESNEWYTPAKYLDAVHAVLGGIDLDPASSEQANAVVRAAKIFTKDDDGLTRDWFGRVFMNPPYGKTPEHRSLAAAFCHKALEQYECGNVGVCIILVNSLHSQSWQSPLYDHTVCFVDHRIHFVSADGDENENPTFQNIFVYLGHDIAKFTEAFSHLGYVMQKAQSMAGL